MPFLVPSLLIGVAAAAIPVIIHLLHRQRTQPVRWGAMQFLLESQLQFKRRRRVDNWLLLLARMALLALLAVLLARPLLNAGANNPLSGNVATDIAVVIDHSLSTGRRAAADAGAAAPSSGDVTVFERSLNVLDEVARHMRPNDTLSVVLAEHRPNGSLTPLPVRTGSVAEVRQKLRQMKPGMTGASVPDAVQAARELVGRGPNTQKLVLVVSDGQRHGWQIENSTAWASARGAAGGATRHFAIPVPPEPRATDVAVGDVTIEPGVVGVNRPAQVTATLTNTGPGDAGAVTATLLVGGKEVDRRSVASLAAGASSTVRFDYTFTAGGSHWVQVKTDANDALDADDDAIAAVNVWQRLPVLVIDGQLTGAGDFRSSQFLVAAMQPVADVSQAAGALIQPKVVSASSAENEKLEEYAAVVVNDVPQLPAPVADALASYARAGNGVWVILGPRGEDVFVERQLSRVGLLTADLGEKRAAPAGTGGSPPVELKSPQNPMVSLLAASERNAFAGAVTRQWWSVSPKDGDEQIVLSSATGDPLVFERPVGRNGGRLVVWCTSADGAWNNWPLMTNFVPLVNETVHHLAAGKVKSSESRRLEAGMPIEWGGPAEPAVKSATITRPDGQAVQRKVTPAGGRQRLSYNDTAEPGLYTLRFDPSEVAQPVYYGVGIDRRELDNTSLSEADYAWLRNRGYLQKQIATSEIASVLGGATQGVELWKWLGLGVLALLVFETVMTRRMVRLQAQRVDVAGVVPAPSGIRI